MKYYTFIILILLILSGTPSKAVAPTYPNPLEGFTYFVLNDLGETEKSKPLDTECTCNGAGFILSGDGLFKKKCPCETCTCKKTMGATVKENKTVRPLRSQELWILVGPKGTCPPCEQLKRELIVLEKAGWSIDWDGDLSRELKFHIRLVDLDKFEGLPEFFFVDGEISLPTLVFFDHFKMTRQHVGYTSRWGIEKIFKNQMIISGKDDLRYAN